MRAGTILLIVLLTISLNGCASNSVFLANTKPNTEITLDQNYSEKEIEELLNSDSKTSETIAIQTISDYKISKFFPQVFDIYMQNPKDIDNYDIEYMDLLNTCVSGMGIEALPFIKREIHKENITPKELPKIAWLLGHLYNSNGLSINQNEEIKNLLDKIANNKKYTYETRLRAIGSLARGGSYEHYETALKALDDESSTEYEKMVAGWALGFIGKQEGVSKAIPILLKGLESNTPSIKYEALHGLGNLGKSTKKISEKKIIGEAIIPYLKQEDPILKINAIVAMQKNIYTPAKIHLINILINDKSPKLREWAAVALNNYNSKDTINALKKGIKDKNFLVRRKSLVSLKTMLTNNEMKKFIKEYLQAETNNFNKLEALSLLHQ